MLESPTVLYGGVLIVFGHFVILRLFGSGEKDPQVRMRALLPAVGIVALITALKLGFEATTAPRNLYSMLEVSRYSSPLEIRASYKTISRKLHPDKNPAPNAQEVFNEIKGAYDILMDMEQRDIYNRFGEGDLSFDPRMDELKLIGSMGAVYLFWVVCGYFATMPKSSKVCRTWITIAGIAMMVVEVTLRLTESTIPTFMPSHVTENMLINSLHSVFPGVILTLRCIAEAYYVDVQKSSMEVLGKVVGQYEKMNEMLDETLAALAGDSDADSEMRLQALKQDIATSNDETKAAIEKFRKASPDPAAGYYWLVIVAMYGALYLASGGEEASQ